MTIRRFALLVAGPRDFAINLVVNSTIPWLVFGSREEVALIGSPSVFHILLPMAFLLGSLTTFFGYFNGVKERRAGVVLPGLERPVPWMRTAVHSGLLVGSATLAVFVVLFFICWQLAGDVAVPRYWAIGGIALLSGLMGYVLHSAAVIRSGSIVCAPVRVADGPAAA